MLFTKDFFLSRREVIPHAAALTCRSSLSSLYNTPTPTHAHIRTRTSTHSNKVQEWTNVEQ